ncbi:MAG: D-alanine--D-alanine ligase [Candidatus Brocadiia bacterium]|jgi:D-alanine-D-alanine ligase
MKVAVAHNAIAEGEKDEATLDVIEQADHVAASLRAAGHAARLFPLDRDVAKTLRKLKLYRPECIFNLVESVEGHAVLHPCAAALWELIGVPHTGSPSWALDHTTDKALAKTLLADAGIATAEWAICRQMSDSWRRVPGPWILKPAMEDASIGIDEDSVVRDPAAVPGKLLALKSRFPNQAVLVERFVDGREFNISLLADERGAQVLPPAEMTFMDYPPGKERVLGYRAKWEPTAFEYEHTGRRFDFPPDESGLIEQMKQIAKRCWALFDLHGYARVDMRVDADSRIFVLEINANPCLTPDAGFAAAVARAGISPAQMVQRILEDTVCVPPLPR